MNYEKAYKEALERARMYHDNAKEAKDYASIARYENIFPELRESEDERIINQLITLVNSTGGVVIIPTNKEELIAWLEKQKINTDGDFARGYDCGYECCLNSHGAEWLENKKEQKPVEIHIDNPNIQKVDPNVKVTTSDSSADGKEQFEKNRLAHCDALSKEDYDRETDFAMEIIEKEHRQPTFSDAINYGMRLQKDALLELIKEESKFWDDGEMIFRGLIDKLNSM